MRDFHIKAQVREGDREGRARKEKRECEGESVLGGGECREGGEGGDETDTHSKRVLALVILSFFFFVQHSLVCVCQRCLSQSKLLH